MRTGCVIGAVSLLRCEAGVARFSRGREYAEDMRLSPGHDQSTGTVFHAIEENGDAEAPIIATGIVKRWLES